MSSQALFDPDQLPIAATLDRQIQAVDRELRFRRHVYPRRVTEGRMTATKAKEEIELMEAVRATLVMAKEGSAP